MKVIDTEIEIGASAANVWQILIDFANYPQWNPFIRQINGTAKEGARLVVEIQPPGRSSSKFRPAVVKVEAERHFSWLGHLLVPGLFDGEHTFIIDPIDENHVRFIHQRNSTVCWWERFCGV